MVEPCKAYPIAEHRKPHVVWAGPPQQLARYCVTTTTLSLLTFSVRQEKPQKLFIFWSLLGEFQAF